MSKILLVTLVHNRKHLVGAAIQSAINQSGLTIFDDALSWKAHQKGIGGEEFILADPVSGASLYYFPLYSPRPCFADFGRKICRP